MTCSPIQPSFPPSTHIILYITYVICLLCTMKIKSYSKHPRKIVELYQLIYNDHKTK